MRFLCRDDHTIERCPPHRFEGAWANASEDAPGILYCRYCGDIRPAQVPVIEAPIEEMVIVEAEE